MHIYDDSVHENGLSDHYEFWYTIYQTFSIFIIAATRSCIKSLKRTRGDNK